MRLLLIAAIIAVGLTPQAPGFAQAPAAPKVQVTFEPDGLVSLVANGATVREILAEWSRLGGSTFVNGERLSGAPMTVQFLHQPEKDVISSVLRQASGFVLGPRRAGSIGASSLEVVYILPTSNPTAGGYVPSPTVPSRPQVSTPGAPDDELLPVQGRGAPAAPPQQQPNAPAQYPAQPGVSGVAVPVVPVVPVTTAPPPTTTTGRGRGGGGR